MVREVGMIKTLEVVESTKTRIPTNKEVFFKNILVATDFSPVSDQALEYAASLARRYRSRIYLTHVITLGGHPMMEPELGESSFEKLRLTAEKSVGEILKSGRLNGIPHKVVIQEGALWPSIEESIKKYEIDLLVVGTRGMGAVRKILIGSGAEEIFRKAKVPVFTVGPSTKKEPFYELEFKNILFATDFGRGAEREAEYAFSLAQEHRARLKFLHVFPHPEEYSKKVLASEVRERITRQLKELVPAGSDLVCKLDFEVAFGEPVEQILRIAQDTNADLIVMGAKARVLLAGNIPHTIAYRMVTGAQCPVLTVKS
jgi:nucleotide-binding universal stress UspA family protein